MAHDYPESRLTGRLVVLRLLVIVASLGVWFLSQSLLGQRSEPLSTFGEAGNPLTLGDAVLMATDSLNGFLHESPAAAKTLLISSSFVIDLLGLFILLRAIIGPSFRPFLGLMILFALRQVSQMLCMLPPPEGIVWEDPGFPSLLVTYGVANDFFFSGHTAIAVYAAIELVRMKGRKWLLVAVAVALFEALSVLVLRAHYTMDVLTGILAAFCAAQVANRVAPALDLRLAKLCNRVRGS